MKLRDYQTQAENKTFEWWQRVRSVLIVLATGCGKTVVFASVIKRLLSAHPSTLPPSSLLPTPSSLLPTPSPRRILVLAHREELILQAKEKIEKIVPGADVQIEMADYKVTDYFGKKADVIVSTVQTQISGPEGAKRMNKFDPNEFAAVIVDEAHHATAKSYREVIDYYCQNENCRVLGVTATPDRADEIALGNVFDAVGYEFNMSDAISEGWLVPVRQKLVKVNSLDFSGVSTSAGDLNSAELAEVMEDERNLHGIAVPVIEICAGRRAIVFAASVKQAERICEIINRSGKMVADWVCGATPKDERRQKLADFKAGKTQVMCNVGVLTEGFDDTGVEVVVMARATLSRALYSQMAGRATRPAEEIAAKLGEVEDAAERRRMIAASTKSACLIVDFVGNSGRHKLATTIDILGGKDVDDDEIRTHARKIIEESDGEMETAEALDAARKAIAARKEIEAKRRAFIQASASYVQIDVDPFNIYDLPPVEKGRDDRTRRLSYKQEMILRTRLKVNPEELGYARSRQLIQEFFRRIDTGMASLPQTKLLKRFGIEVPLRRAEATRILDRLMKN